MTEEGWGSAFRRHRAAVVTLAVVLVLVLFFREPKKAAGTPFVPSSPDQVLERLPSFSEGKRAKELRVMREALARDPSNLPLAVAVAKAAIELSRSRSDPRYLGQAEAALLPFWAAVDPPPVTLTLRATLRQSQHDFEGALVDLDRVIQRTPGDTQAWLTRAVVRTVLGRYAEARADCMEVAKSTSRLVAAVCVETITSLTGDAKGAYQRLGEVAAAARTSRISPAELAWAESTLGELAVRAGASEEGRAHFVAALEADAGDAYVLAALSDLDLDTGRAADVIPRLRGKEENDMLLLRLALAEDTTHAKEAEGHAKELAARFHASALRGDVVHRREEARYRLWLEHDAEAALVLAEKNWTVQHEVADARILFEAAIAAKKKDRAAPARTWLETTRCEEPSLVALAKELAR